MAERLKDYKQCRNPKCNFKYQKANDPGVISWDKTNHLKKKFSMKSR